MSEKPSKKERKVGKLKQKQKQHEQALKKIVTDLAEKDIAIAPNQPKEEIEKQEKKQISKNRANQTKLKKLSADHSGDENSERGNEDDDLEFNQEVNENVDVSFLIAEINEKYYHSLKTILEKLSRATGITSSDWADAIISNSQFGNVAEADEDDDDEEEEEEEENEEEEDDEDNVCSGVISILPYSSKIALKMKQKFHKSYQKHKSNGKLKEQFFTKLSCSLMICERAINLPAFIVQSMHEVLVSDIKKMQKCDTSSYSKVCGDYVMGLGEVEVPRGQGHENIDNLIFAKFEDYQFLKHSMCWWVGESSANSFKKTDLRKLFYILRMSSYFEAVSKLNELMDPA